MATMSRPVLLAALLTAAAAAQSPELVALLRDPSGKPVVGARGMVRGHTAAVFPALGDLQPFEVPGRHAPRAWCSGTSDERGVLRLAQNPPAAPPGAAAGIVWTEDGLGALVVDLYAGRAQRLDLQPMAELTTAAGTATIRVHARAHLPGGRTVLPFTQPGTSVRLPAGDYELWVQNGERWIWQRRTLLSAQRTLLSFDGAGPTLAADAAAELVFPAGRPDVRLATADHGCILVGAAATAPLVALRDGIVHGPAVLRVDPAPASLQWPAPDPVVWRQAHLDVPPGHAGATQVFSLLREASGGWRVLASRSPGRSRSRSQRAEPWVSLPAPPDGDAWQLFVARGFAPQARPWPREANAPQFTFERGVPLQVVCRDENGLPLVDVAVDYVPEGMEPATVAAHSDAFGVARLGPVLGPGRVQVSDPRFANQTVELTTIPVEPLPVTIGAGETLHGAARWPDGAPAAGVVVTLRDASGALRPAERAVVSGDDGTFVFPGLTANRALVLFAATKRDGRTWSGKLDRLLPGGGTIELVVRDEDPRLLPR
jgi:hypothetical protein